MAHFAPDPEAEPGSNYGSTGSIDPDQTSPFGICGSITSLDQLKREQEQLLHQLRNSGEGVAEGDEGSLSLNGAMASKASLEPGGSSDGDESLPGAILSPTAISMPGLQPFPRGKKPLPSSWSDCTLAGDVPFCLVMLSKQSWEFQSILAEFTDVGMTVRKIERIENRDLWEKFEFERRRTEKNTREVNEVYLFHGTPADKDQICLEGLDQRLSRIGFFGRGIYFSNDPRKCLSYTETNQKGPLQSTCTVYKCRVLLGNMKVYPSGEHAMDLKREPLIENPEPGGTKYYDSVKGHVKDFDEFILYKSERVLPEYAIFCYLPPPSSAQDAPVEQTAWSPTDHSNGTAQEDAPSGGNEEKGQADGASRHPQKHEDDEEISAEVAAGALGQPTRSGSPKTELRKDGEEISLELGNGGQREVPGRDSQKLESKNGERDEVSLEVSEGDDLGELEEGDVYEQLHQMEILSAIRANRRVERELDLRVSSRTEQSGGHQWKPSHSRMMSSPAGHQPIPKNPGALLKFASLPTLTSDKRDITVNSLQEPRRQKKEAIAPECLPAVMEVREKLRKERLQEQGKQSVSSKAPRWVREETSESWEIVEQQKLLAQVREKVLADRKKEDLEKQRQKGTGRGAKQLPVTDNSSSLNWTEDAQDTVGEVLDVLIVQFMDITACDDILEAKQYVLQANMDVNNAVISYISS